MLTIYPSLKTCENVTQLLHKYFWGNSTVQKSTLERKVSLTIIQEALDDGLIILSDDQYLITSKGDEYLRKGK